MLLFKKGLIIFTIGMISALVPFGWFGALFGTPSVLLATLMLLFVFAILMLSTNVVSSMLKRIK